MRSNSRFAWQVVFGLSLSVAVPALADGVPTVDGSITDVLVGSTNSQDYRVVVSCGGFEHVQCAAWAQWLTHDTTSGTRIAQSTPIKELNGHGFVLGRLERSPAASSFVAMAGVAHTHVMSATGRFELSLREPGHYEFRWLEAPSFAEIE